MHVTDYTVCQEIIHKVHVETVATLNPAEVVISVLALCKCSQRDIGAFGGIALKGSNRKMYYCECVFAKTGSSWKLWICRALKANNAILYGCVDSAVFK